MNKIKQSSQCRKGYNKSITQDKLSMNNKYSVRKSKEIVGIKIL